MIKVNDLRNTDGDRNTVLISAFSDTKAEVATTPISDYIGMPKNMTIEMGSDMMTADGEMAFMKSDGTWNWLS